MLAQEKRGAGRNISSGWTASEKHMTFEVASVRPQQSGVAVGTGMNLTPSPDGYRSALTVWQMLMLAYAPGGYESWVSTPVTNTPSWSGDWYVINARVSDADREAWNHQTRNYELLHLAMQALLKDRFKLVVHEKPTQIPDYKLVVRKKGPQFKTAVPLSVVPKGAAPLRSGGVMVAEQGGPSIVEHGGITSHDHRTIRHFYGATMDDLADFLSGSTQRRPVHNGTGLTGRYDFTLESIERPSLEPDEAVYNWPVEPLGLELKYGTSPGFELAIDHIERPTAN
ncbi:MAG TPA: TIGR03435 family protein [Acidobacteriaceae bacterium]|nr:TIGR03435 family protein [Acidobacteriaceae bacterium]